MSRANELPNTLKPLPRSLFDLYSCFAARSWLRHATPHWSVAKRRWRCIRRHHPACANIGFRYACHRRRVDGVWVEAEAETGIASQDAAVDELKRHLSGDQHKEVLPANTAPRPALHDISNRQPSSVFRALSTPSHHVAAWTLNQLLSLCRYFSDAGTFRQVLPRFVPVNAGQQ